MGISSSISLAKPFADITTIWPKGKFDNVLKVYTSFKFDYVVDGTEIQKFFNSTKENSFSFVNALSLYYTGIINRDLFMITIILLYEIELRDEKIGRIFDFMDVNKEGQLSYNQMMILMMRLGESLACIIGQKRQFNSIHGPLVQYVKYVYASLGKRYTDKITKPEFVNWAKYDLFDSSFCLFDEIFGHITTVRPEYDRVINYGPLADAASSGASSAAGGHGRRSVDHRPSLTTQMIEEALTSTGGETHSSSSSSSSGK